VNRADGTLSLAEIGLARRYLQYIRLLGATQTNTLAERVIEEVSKNGED
jgi:hypothetical protein